MNVTNERQAGIAEIAPGIHRIAIYHEPWRSSVNQYLVVDDEPALISTGLRSHFQIAWSLIGRVIDPATLRHIVVLHYEADECGALNEFLTHAPDSVAYASTRTALGSLHDSAIREARGLADGELLSLGAHGLRVLEAPYVHAWDGIVLADEREKVVFTGDLFIQPGQSEPLTRNDRSALSAQLYRTFYGVPPETYLLRALDRIEGTVPVILAPGHGSALTGVLSGYFRAYRNLVTEGRPSRPVEAVAALR